MKLLKLLEKKRSYHVSAFALQDIITFIPATTVERCQRNRQSQGILRLLLMIPKQSNASYANVEYQT